MKKISCLLFSLLLFVSFCISALAYDYAAGDRTALLNDKADLIPYEDEEVLNYKLEQISDTYKCEIAVLTVNSTDNKDITAFSDDYFDYNGFGYGENDDGIMLVVDMGSREFAITTHGKAISIFTDYDLYALESKFTPLLTEGNYTSAFVAFYEGCAAIIDEYNFFYENNIDENYIASDDWFYEDSFFYDDYGNNVYYPEKTITQKILSAFSLTGIAFAVIAGIIIALIYTSILKSQLKTVHSKASADDYVISDSINITRSHDIFMYKNVRRSPKSNNSNCN